jgi:hypothetical protein
VVFFVCALMCHGELARTRPAAKYLTAFYLWMSLGGVIGGIAAGLIAPHVFNWVAEYPILLALALLCRPGRMLPEEPLRRYALLGGLAAALLVAIVAARNPTLISPDLIEDAALTRVLMALLIISVLFWYMPLPFAAIVALVLSLHHSVLEDTGVLASPRSARPPTAAIDCSSTAPRCMAASAFVTMKASRSPASPSS